MDLLDYLQFGCSLTYLSDLTNTHVNTWKYVLNAIVPEQFPLKDWNQAIHYLCREKIQFHSAREAKEYLLNYNPQKTAAPICFHHFNPPL